MAELQYNDLPDLVPLYTASGQELLHECEEAGTSFYNLYKPTWHKQRHESYCGIATTAFMLNVLNDLAIENDTRAWRKVYDEDNMMKLLESRRVVSEEEVKEFGIGLETWTKLLRAHGTKVKMYPATCDDADVDNDAVRFRECIKKTFPHAFQRFGKKEEKKLDKPGQSCASVMAVNYDVATLGQGKKRGHISPLAAYHARSDRVLLMDTWPESDVCWVKPDKLWLAMHTRDIMHGYSRRGWVVCKLAPAKLNTPEGGYDTQFLPV